MHGFVLTILVIFPVGALSAIANTASWTESRRTFSASAAAALYNGGKLDGALQTAAKKDKVELLRYVTAYKKGIEAVVDVTPYSPLIRAAIAKGNFTMYSLIDTWVSNNSNTTVLYLNNETTKCTAFNTSDGNGWGVSLDLLFWPKQSHMSKQPSESITISPGFYGGMHDIGRVSVHKGRIAGNGSAIFFEKKPDLDSVDMGIVYDVDHNASIGLASLLGYVARQSELLTMTNNSVGVEYITHDAKEILLGSYMAGFKVTAANPEKRTVSGKYNGSELEWQVGMPVFYDPSRVFTDRNMDNGLWLNSSVPMQPVGRIVYVDGENLTVLLNSSCLPCKKTYNLPGFMIPVKNDTIKKITSLVQSASNAGTSAAVKLLSESSFTTMHAPRANLRSPQLLVPSEIPLLEPSHTAEAGVRLKSPTVLGHLALVNVSNASLIALMQSLSSGSNVADGKDVVIITQQRHGLLMNKTFQLPDNLDEKPNYLHDGARVIMQLTVTGHGWASTSEQCGEYCHAVYRISLNGNSAANVTQFRDDCKDNPISHQYGTWDESRNGWCPGTVLPGIYIDVTKHLRPGSNNITIDLMVWSNSTLQYEPYTDFSGFIYNDVANLIVATNAFIYNKSTVESILKEGRARTAAELAIKIGSSAPSRLSPPAFVREPVLQDVLLQTSPKSRGTAAEEKAYRAALSYRKNRHKGLPFMGKDASYAPSVMWDDEEDQIVNEAPAPHSSRARMARAEIRPGGTTKHSDIHEHRWSDVAISSDAEVKPKPIPLGFDFERRAPWYLYNSSEEGQVQAIRVPVFKSRLQQGSSRHVEQLIEDNFSFPDWGHVALHLRLHDPPAPLQMDHWDRVGSIGLSF